MPSLSIDKGTTPKCGRGLPRFEFVKADPTTRMAGGGAQEIVTGGMQGGRQGRGEMGEMGEIGEGGIRTLVIKEGGESGRGGCGGVMVVDGVRCLHLPLQKRP